MGLSYGKRLSHLLPSFELGRHGAISYSEPLLLGSVIRGHNFWHSQQAPSQVPAPAIGPPAVSSKITPLFYRRLLRLLPGSLSGLTSQALPQQLGRYQLVSAAISHPSPSQEDLYLAKKLHKVTRVQDTFICDWMSDESSCGRVFCTCSEQLLVCCGHMYQAYQHGPLDLGGRVEQPGPGAVWGMGESTT